MHTPPRLISTRFAPIGLLAAGALVLAACGGDDGEQTGSGEADSFAGETLRLWHYEGDNSAMGIAWDEAIDIFEDETGATVEFEEKSFEQIRQTANMVLNTDEAPDIMEYNKGNASAGLLASQGLLTDISDAVEEYGWDEKLAPTVQTTARYDDNGVMGSGSWYGIPNYGEFVMVYYNEDLFAEHGIEIPETYDDLVAAMDEFVDAGVTPLAMSGAEYPAGQLFYELALTQADRQFVNDYQLYENPVDFSGPELRYGAETFSEWVEAGYIGDETAGLAAEDMGTSFIAGDYPMLYSGSWWYGRFVDEIESFDWSVSLFPGSDLHPGSSGNLWVVPTAAENEELAYEFIEITMRPEIQATLGNNGGVPVAAEPDDIDDDKSLELISLFEEAAESDGLAYYPDWPVPGFYDDLVGALQELINQNATPEEVLEQLQVAYDAGVEDITN
ncbi:extracellular solute-binding protein [Actinobacteria bacterium YIM 96077]|uniref:Carbohydrate ABC transporter substrate-binding protein n=1 Tax=Phytoactinopolyspora halophila TaxID=1981511 RepID=A0A329QEV5_9ACTN|nr:extracellular solute-binding protein [Phytoactinopolyspora halophila]AYY13430.1 extracellular solute-binding protein [Actinobacteria bacterium YIM 96077]RAW10824.1 carbohydrate ABC transporter substrate-binding protein [Phytoactinopolyspora halophila]